MSTKNVSVKQKSGNWWQDKKFIKELDRRYKDLMSGTDRGITKEQLITSINQLRQEKYSK